MRVLVTGGRLFGVQRSQRHLVEAALQSTLEAEADRLGSEDDEIEFIVIQGGANGADKAARDWAVKNGHVSLTFDAPWGHYGSSAGPIRNGWMLQYGKPDLVLAFPGGLGTANMVSQAEAAKVPVRRIAMPDALVSDPVPR